MSAAAADITPPRKRRLPAWVWILCVLAAGWLAMALWGQMIRDEVVANPVEVQKEAEAKEADAQGKPLPGTVQAMGDLDLPPVRPEPVSAADDRGWEVLNISEKRCGKLHKSFKAKWNPDKTCEVYLHEIRRQGDMVFVMASPEHGVQDNGRPIITVLPATAYQAGGI